MHAVRIEGPGGPRGTKVFVDGVQVEGLVDVSFCHQLNKVPVVEVDLLAASHSIDIANARVVVSRGRTLPLRERLKLAWRLVTARHGNSTRRDPRGPAGPPGDPRGQVTASRRSNPATGLAQGDSSGQASSWSARG